MIDTYRFVLYLERGRVGLGQDFVGLGQDFVVCALLVCSDRNRRNRVPCAHVGLKASSQSAQKIIPQFGMHSNIRNQRSGPARSAYAFKPLSQR